MTWLRWATASSGNTMGRSPDAWAPRRLSVGWGGAGAGPHPELQRQLSLGGWGQLATLGMGALAGPGAHLGNRWPPTSLPLGLPDRCPTMMVQLEGQRKARASVFVHHQASASVFVHLQGSEWSQGRDVCRQG